jgi:hypothetical protein
MHFKNDGVNYSTTAPAWDSGYRYFLETWAEDNLGNVEVRKVRRFTVDIVPPASAVTVPTNNQSLQSLGVVSGTAADATSGIDSVFVTIWNLGADTAAGTADDLYWNSSTGWDPAPSQVTANLIGVYTTSATWDITPTGNKLPSSWTSGRYYRLIPQARDSAQNLQVVFSTLTFQIDNVAPTAGIITPPHNSGYSTLSTLSGTAGGSELSGGRDFSTISSVTLQIIDINTSPVQYWNGAIFTNTISTRTATFTGASSGTWVYNDATIDSQFISGHSYRVIARAADSAGNTQSSFTVGISSNVFYYDNVASTSSISVPVNGTPYRTFTSFSGGATDDFSGVSGVDLTVS